MQVAILNNCHAFILCSVLGRFKYHIHLTLEDYLSEVVSDLLMLQTFQLHFLSSLFCSTLILENY